MTNKQVIKKSAEANYYLHDFKLISIGYTLLVLFSTVVIVAVLIDHLHYMKVLLLIYLIGITCLYLPFAVYFASKYLSLFSSVDDYVFCEKHIDNVHFTGNNAYFSITMADSQGNTFCVNTKAIYHSNYKKPHYEEFYQKKAIVAYNSATSQVVLIDVSEYMK